MKAERVGMYAGNERRPGDVWDRQVPPIEIAHATLDAGRHDGAPNGNYTLVVTQAPTSFVRSSPLHRHHYATGRSFCCLRRPDTEVPIEIVAPSASVLFVQVAGAWLQERLDEAGMSILAREALAETIDPSITLLAEQIHHALATSVDPLDRGELDEALLLHLVMRFGDHAERVGNIPAARMRALLDYIDQHLSHALSLDDLARVARARRFGFARSFTRIVGISPHRYVMARRAAQAVRMIQRQELPFAEIAASVGFYDQAHMSRWISRELRLTPTQVARASKAASRPS